MLLSRLKGIYVVKAVEMAAKLGKTKYVKINCNAMLKSYLQNYITYFCFEKRECLLEM
jgi:hypothetical protein